MRARPVLASQADSARSKIGSMAVVGVFEVVISVVIIRKRISIMPSRQIKIDMK